MDGLIIGLLLPFAGTTLGAACVFLMKKQMPDLVQKTLLGFASGVMVAASVWSLLIPSIEMSGTEDATRVIPAVSGFIAGIAFLLLMDRITPHLHLGSPSPEDRTANCHGQACWYWPSPCTIFRREWL